MRGLSAGSQASQGSGSTGLWPNVAIYLDNQSGQLPNRNLDVYAADLNRIEVLRNNLFIGQRYLIAFLEKENQFEDARGVDDARL